MTGVSASVNFVQRRLKKPSTMRPALRKDAFSALWAISVVFMCDWHCAMKSVAAAASSSLSIGFGTRAQPISRSANRTVSSRYVRASRKSSVSIGSRGSGGWLCPGPGGRSGRRAGVWVIDGLLEERGEGGEINRAIGLCLGRGWVRAGPAPQRTGAEEELVAADRAQRPRRPHQLDIDPLAVNPRRNTWGPGPRAAPPLGE